MTQASKAAFPLQVFFISLALIPLGCSPVQPVPSIPSESQASMVKIDSYEAIDTSPALESSRGVVVLLDKKRDVVCYVVNGSGSKGPSGISCLRRPRVVILGANSDGR